MHIGLNLKEFPAQFFEQSIKALLCLLLLALLGTICAGVVKTFIELQHCVALILEGGTLHEGFKMILIDVLSILAVLEVFRTAQAYFTEGRVKVTYIIDTVLVAVLTEILAFWYREIETERMAVVIVLVIALMGVRIMAIRFSPNRLQLTDGL